MIRWCSYCQQVLGEIAPYDDPSLSHGLCDLCDARLARDEPLIDQTEARRSLMKRIFDCARTGDLAGCSSVLDAAARMGLSTESVLIGLLQPALYQAGLDWQLGRMTVASEHNLTSWCERAFALLPPAPPAGTPVPLATEMVRRLRERLLPQTPSGYVLSGHAFRVGAGVSAPPPPGVSVVRTIDEFVALAGARA